MGDVHGENTFDSAARCRRRRTRWPSPGKCSASGPPKVGDAAALARWLDPLGDTHWVEVEDREIRS